MKKRQTAVFLPYKASMWDSMESVYFAAKEDSDVDVLVIPIPYYDKNPDGSVKEWHYEGDLFPSYVEITDYKSYDISKEKPEYVFIHNPYDEFNNVTSVAKEYYAARLKNVTNCLVYIPYYVLGSYGSVSDNLVKNVSVYACVPGVAHSHMVFVEDEIMRNVYIRAMTDFAGANTKKIWEKKIFGTGSPKYDRIRNLNPNDIVIPDDWKEKIYNENGEQKKIILFNSTVSGFLHDTPARLEKMLDVFRVFKERRDEVTLLWRPHPLVLPTLDSMRPQYSAIYRQLVEAYKAENWGIYDDTPDIDRAIVISDGYYGNQSSVVWMCQSIGTPALIQALGHIGDCLYGKTPENLKSVILYEDSVGLETFIEAVLSLQILSNQAEKGTAGAEIWKTVKRKGIIEQKA